MITVIFLGKDNRYLGYKNFQYRFQADLFIDKLEPLMLANIEKALTLRERLQLCPEYFPYSGSVQDIDLIEITNNTGDQNEPRE